MPDSQVLRPYIEIVRLRTAVFGLLFILSEYEEQLRKNSLELAAEGSYGEAIATERVLVSGARAVATERLALREPLPTSLDEVELLVRELPEILRKGSSHAAAAGLHSLLYGQPRSFEKATGATVH